ncbi:MAG: flavin reductase family protein [Planctomycetales bacterium]|nr:flavin reductase family protein [bacterium]UNM09977.1 MAG: flavin reductase family protein [Planctomycetales bacterium]
MHIDPQTLSPGRRYFLMISAIVPRPIAWVGTNNEAGGHNLAPFSFFNAFSATPPVVGLGFSPTESKPGKDTLLNIRRTGELTISICDLQHGDQLHESSAELPYGEDEFAATKLTPAFGSVVSAPFVKEAPVSMECRLRQVIEFEESGGAMILADVLMFHIRDTLIDARGAIDPHRLKPLARMGGGRYASLGEIFKLPSYGQLPD